MKASTAVALTFVGTVLLGSGPARAAENSIVDVAAKAKTFQTLLAAAKAAGLAGDLATVDGLTVFAPTDKAFGKLGQKTIATLLKPENKEKLKAILAYHVVPGRVTSAQIPHKPTSVATLNTCAPLRVVRSGHTVRADGARVVAADIQASNGIIHVIDKVMLPPATCQ